MDFKMLGAFMLALAGLDPGSIHEKLVPDV